MIIGGQAALLYGEPRLTKDIDITLGAGLERRPEIVAAAQAAGLTLGGSRSLHSTDHGSAVRRSSIRDAGGLHSVFFPL
jgi:hypothetical protein